MTTLTEDGTLLAGPALVNLFPARADSSDGTSYEAVRVVLCPDMLVIYTEDNHPNEGGKSVRTAAAIPLTSAYATAGEWRAVDDTGRTWTVKTDRGCGCGSLLRAMPGVPPVHLERWPN